MSNLKRRGPLIVAVSVGVLLVAHQDNWFWTDDTAVFGFVPIGLAYHAGISIAASIVWFVATQIAWPLDDAGGVADGGAAVSEPSHAPE